MKNKGHAFLLIFSALLIPIIPFLIIGELPGERWLSTTDDNSFLFGLSGAGLLASDILLPIPSSILGSLLGARLGFLTGWFWTCLGLMLGSLVGYLVGHAWPDKLKAELPRTPTVLILFASRSVPVLAEAISITSGAVRMPLKPFLLASISGNAFYSLVLTANGATLLPDNLVGPGLAIPMLLPVVAWLIWRRLDKDRKPQT